MRNITASIFLDGKSASLARSYNFLAIGARFNYLLEEA